MDDFAVACPDQKTADILYDLIDDKLSIPLKRQGLIETFNGMDIDQTRYYIKVSCQSYIERICAKYLTSWMKKVPMSDDRPTPLPTDSKWLKTFNEAKGDPDGNVQKKLAKTQELTYRAGVGELIYAMTTVRPDTAFAAVKLSQSSVCPAEIHYHGLKRTLRYLYHTREDGLHFWRSEPQCDLPEKLPPVIRSNRQDLLLQGRPEHGPLDLVSYADADWATCPKTRRSFGGSCVRLSGCTVGYKCKFHPTVATSSTHAEFMSAHDTARMNLYIRSVLWDLDIPQEAATICYEDNDAATAMGNARKPTPRTRHIDIKYYSLSEWIEQDMIALERIDTSLNMSDHFTKPLPRALFHRHVDYIMGHVPPAYSPIYDRIIGNFDQLDRRIEMIPTSFTTPTTATATHIFAPDADDILNNPWTKIVWHGEQ